MKLLSLVRAIYWNHRLTHFLSIKQMIRMNMTKQDNKEMLCNIVRYPFVQTSSWDFCKFVCAFIKWNGSKNIFAFFYARTVTSQQLLSLLLLTYIRLGV